MKHHWAPFSNTLTRAPHAQAALTILGPGCTAGAFAVVAFAVVAFAVVAFALYRRRPYHRRLDSRLACVVVFGALAHAEQAPEKRSFPAWSSPAACSVPTAGDLPRTPLPTRFRT
jgi:hypothetical protein